MQQALPTHPLSEKVKPGPKGGVPTVKSKKKGAIPVAMLTLDYPLYACDFDPSGKQGEARLVVGGGGGAGKNGVGNRITAINAMDPDTLHPITELDIGKKDDNPTSLAVGQSVGGYTFVYAGVNTGGASGKSNQHFRMYAMGKKNGSGKTTIEEASRASMFSSKDKSTYQRVLRLSRASPDGMQLGAAATGFGAPHELVIFDAVVGQKSKGVRGSLELEKEAEDVDIIQTGPEEFLVAYCDNQEVYLKAFGPSKEIDQQDAVCVYEMPQVEDGNGGLKKAHHNFRALRFLTPEFVAVLVNKPQNGGAYVRILRIMASTTGPTARVAQTLGLPSKVKKATGFAISNLHPPAVPGSKQQNTQFVFAIADGTSISIASMDYKVMGGNAIVYQPRNLLRVVDVHPMSITGTAFQFVSPTLANARMPQILRLASVSVGQTVVVQSIPIYKKDGDEHYTVALKPSTNGGPSARGIISTLGMILVAFMIQVILELGDKSPRVLNARHTMPSIVVRFFEADPESKFNVEQREHFQRRLLGHAGGLSRETKATLREFREHPIATILESLKKEREEGQHIVVRPSTPEHTDGGAASGADGGHVEEVVEEHITTFNADDATEARAAIQHDIKIKRNNANIRAELHDEEAHGPLEHQGKTWEELGEEQKDKWIERLKEVGEWAGEVPVALFKGVVFGEIGAAVGRGVAGL